MKKAKNKNKCCALSPPETSMAMRSVKQFSNFNPCHPPTPTSQPAPFIINPAAHPFLQGPVLPTCSPNPTACSRSSSIYLSICLSVCLSIYISSAHLKENDSQPEAQPECEKARAYPSCLLLSSGKAHMSTARIQDRGGGSRQSHDASATPLCMIKGNALLAMQSSSFSLPRLLFVLLLLSSFTAVPSPR